MFSVLSNYLIYKLNKSNLKTCERKRNVFILWWHPYNNNNVKKISSLESKMNVHNFVSEKCVILGRISYNIVFEFRFPQ